MIIARTVLCAALSAAVFFVPARPVMANDDFAKALIGAMILGGIASAANNQQNAGKGQGQQRRAAAVQRSQAEIQAAKELQAALNHFGFDAGPVDGMPGRQTKMAVASYQGTLGHPQTGEITAVERQLLLDSMARERLNPAEAMQLAATNPYGRNGLPAEYRRLASMPAAQAAAPTPTPTVAPAAASADASASDQAAMPSFGVPTEPTRSVNGHCNQIGVLTTTNGGFATADSMPDATLALNEQFCLARTFAIAEGQKIATSVGATQEQISSLCQQLKARLQTKLEGLATSKPDVVVAAIRADIDQSGKSAEEMAVTGRICLAEGYRTDDPAMSNSAVVTLVASDQKPYAELVGHHLREGFGVAANAATSKVWMQYALDALKAGAAPSFLPGQAEERTAILTKALGTN